MITSTCMQKMWVKILKNGPNEIFSQISSKTCPEAITSPSNKLLMQPRMLFWQSKHMFDINTSRFCIDMMPCYSFIILQAGYRCKVQSLALAARIMFLHTSTYSMYCIHNWTVWGFFSRERCLSSTIMFTFYRNGMTRT